MTAPSLFPEILCNVLGQRAADRVGVYELRCVAPIDHPPGEHRFAWKDVTETERPVTSIETRAGIL